MGGKAGDICKKGGRVKCGGAYQSEDDELDFIDLLFSVGKTTYI